MDYGKKGRKRKRRREKKRGREKHRLVAASTGIKSTTFLMYWVTLQSTEPPGQFSPMTFKKTEWIINICFLKIPTQTISLVIAIKYWGINNFLMQCFPEEKQKKASSPILFMRLVSIIEQGHYKKWELYDIITLLIY